MLLLSCGATQAPNAEVPGLAALGVTTGAWEKYLSLGSSLRVSDSEDLRFPNSGLEITALEDKFVRQES